MSLEALLAHDPDAVLRLLDKVDAEEGLLNFTRVMWPVLEPATRFVYGWPVEAVCEHLEAVTFGQITRLLINVPPGSMKSLSTNVFWPAWEWGPQNRPHERYISFSYGAHLTERDNRRFRDIIKSPVFQANWGDRFSLTKDGETLVSNDHTGFKLATSTGGIGTGERGSRVMLDDPHNVKEIESDKVRQGTVEWFAQSMSNRLNDMKKSAIVVVMQRLHEEDVSGYILAKELGYEHLCIPAEFDATRGYDAGGDKIATSIGWRDPRTEDGELFWEDRFPPEVLESERIIKGPYGYSGQYQQSPTPKGGGIIKLTDWRLWEDPAYPPFDYIVASLDSAYTEKEENDFSALTIWGMWNEQAGRRIAGSHVPQIVQDMAGATRIMLMYAWNKKLELHGRYVEQAIGESEKDWKERQKSEWGLCEWVADSCQRYKVDKLLIEAKASGHSVAQEIKRLIPNRAFGVELINPGAQDKVARAWAVQPMFSEGMVYAPDKAWANMVMEQCAKFPKATAKDLVDSTTQALRHLRDTGIARSTVDRIEDTYEAMQLRKPLKPLYPV